MLSTSPGSSSAIAGNGRSRRRRRELQYDAYIRVAVFPRLNSQATRFHEARSIILDECDKQEILTRLMPFRRIHRAFKCIHYGVSSNYIGIVEIVLKIKAFEYYM